MSTATVQGYETLMRDVRHLAARAAPDLADWLAFLEVDGKADRTLYSYMRAIAALLRAYPDHEFGDFTPVDITAVLAKVPVQSRYINRSIYNGFFQWGEDQERIDRNPMVGKVPKMRQPKRRPRDIFSEEEIALLEGLPSPDGPLWTLLFGTGLRRGEARKLRRDHVNLERARLVVYHGKGDDDRIIGLGTTSLKAVADLDLYEGLQRSDYLWYKDPRGKPYTSRRAPIGDTTFENWYKRGIAAAGVRYLNPHQTRHTFGHRLRERNYDLEYRQKAMGHRRSSTTEFYYGRVTYEDVAAAIAESDL